MTIEWMMGCEGGVGDLTKFSGIGGTVSVVAAPAVGMDANYCLYLLNGG